ncbi:MAG TPA: ABC transporter ATP-binding protein [Clostridia bacterium]
MKKTPPAYPILQPSLRLLRQMGPWKRMFVPGVVMSASVQLMFSLLLAGFYGDATAAILAGTTERLAFMALVYAVPLTGILSLTAVSHYLIRTSVARATADLRSQVVRHLLAAPLEAGLADHSGIKTSLLINDVPAAMESLSRAVSRPLESLIRGLGSFIYVAWIDERIALVALAVSSLGILYSLPFARAMRRAGDRVQAAMAASTVHLNDLLGGVVAARVYGMGDSMRGPFDGQVDIARREGLRRARISAALAMFNNGYSGLSQAALLFVSGSLAIAGRYDAPTFIRVVQMAPGIYGMFAFSRWLSDLMGSLSGAQRVWGALDRPAEAAEDGPAPDPVAGAPAVRLRDVRFGHDPARPVLRGVTFEVYPGEMAAIVGESGNGKSTILRILQGMYRLDRGDAEINGVPIARWPLGTLRRQMALVPQDAVLVSGTLRENLSLGREGADEGAIREAARLAGADRFIRRLPQGYDTLVGERGASLSGGQRQRIAIARALVKDAPILLLDEATSALDAQAESAVRQAARALRGTRTMIVVAHRLATIRDADRILVLKDGRVVEQGRHEELLQLGGNTPACMRGKD